MSAAKLLKISAAFSPLIRPNSVRTAHNFVSATCAQTLVNLPQTQVTTLDNGFKIASEHSDSPASTVGIWIDAGSRFESAEKNGVANFLEHMLFKGTAKRSQKDLETEIQNLGAEFNSYTGREETAFYSRCLSSDVPKAVDILSDVIQNSKLDEGLMEKERNVILKEMDETDSDLRAVAMDYLHLTAYQGTPLGRSVLGPSENIKNITRDDLSFYTRNNFLAPRMALVATGDVKHDELVKLAEKHFSSTPMTYVTEIPTIDHCRFTGSEVRARDDYLPFAHVAIAVDTCGHDSPDIYPLTLAKTIVGSWDKTFPTSEHTGNRVIEDIYKGKGCHSFESFHTSYRDTGLWGTYFVVDGPSLDDFFFNLQNEWIRMCVGITETDLQIAKNMLRCNFLQQVMQGTDTTCKDIARQVLFHGKRTSLAEAHEKIQNVTLTQMKEVCSKYIYDRCPAVAAIGPLRQLPDYTRVRANMYWLRY